MPPVELEARVRPSKVVVLLGDNAPMNSLLLAVRFLSRLWGGRYFPIIPVAPSGVSQAIAHVIRRDLPEFVFGVGVEDEAWRSEISHLPAVRGYGRLESEYVERFFREPTREDLVSYRPLIQAGLHGRGLQQRVISCGSAQPQTAGQPPPLLGPHISVIYGEPALRPGFPGYWPPHQTLTANGIDSTANLVHQWMANSLHGITWLDAMCGQLDVHISNGALPSGPTIVLVQSPADLALCWTLRRTRTHDWPSWIIPIPAERSTEESTIEALSLWLRESARFSVWDRRATITSLTSPLSLLEAVANALCPEFGEGHIRALNGCNLLEALPTVVAAERSRVYSLSVEKQILSWQLPRPSWHREKNDGTWVVDYLPDRRTGRSLCELALPSRRACLDTLNAPAPTPHSTYGLLERYGLTPEGISARSHGDKEVTHQWLPTAEEVVGALLAEGHIEPIQSELRGLYLSAIELLGGLEQAAAACVGPARLALRYLEADPRTLDELRNLTRQGNKTIPSLEGSGYFRFLLENLSPTQQGIAEKRFTDLRNVQQPATANLQGLLDYWAEKGIVQRSWQLPQCRTCLQTRWLDCLDIRQETRCPVCGIKLQLPHRMELGYALNPLLRESLSRGFAPVILTARFLDWMTMEGFIWLPTQKLKWQGNEAEIDVIACADRRLVLAECKDLENAGPSSPSWTDVWGQFEQLVEIAVACHADLVVLGVLAEQFPDDWQTRAKTLAGTRVRVLLLNRTDLEAGRRLRTLPPGIPSGENIVGELRVHIRDLFAEPLN